MSLPKRRQYKLYINDIITEQLRESENIVMNNNGCPEEILENIKKKKELEM
jgi:hypothetical protein